MAAVQQGMKSLGFRGPRPNPYMERSTANLHRNLAKYMGTGMPRKIKVTSVCGSGFPPLRVAPAQPP